MDQKKKAADMLVGRGLLLYREGAVKHAIRLWRSALELVPDHTQARRFLKKVTAGKTSVREAMTERIDSSKLKEMLAECRPTGSHDAANTKTDDAADEFSAKTQPVVPEELIEQAAQSWVDSPEDNLEITIDDNDEGAEDEVDLLERISSGTVSLEEWTESRSPVPDEDDLPITVEEPREEDSPGDDFEIVVSERKKPGS